MKITPETAASLFAQEYGATLHHEDDERDLIEFGQWQLECTSNTMKALSAAIGSRPYGGASVADLELDAVMQLLSGQASMAAKVFDIILVKHIVREKGVGISTETLREIKNAVPHS
ncbi:hypothetical protein [Thiothrix winogradskyi]|uniref:Uncharacterized protein n=1 Tax=Thiothrix winogradskyi TaxID=96472 RepID=A0ABY3T476_9GAMM|nr:hypothetical protein [Thiothrix winogradskyi]UJS26054.1 hypothetical protein L2Y54_08445 [Thiothrix winogradskyi]